MTGSPDILTYGISDTLKEHIVVERLYVEKTSLLRVVRLKPLFRPSCEMYEMFGFNDLFGVARILRREVHVTCGLSRSFFSRSKAEDVIKIG